MIKSYTLYSANYDDINPFSANYDDSLYQSN